MAHRSSSLLVVGFVASLLFVGGCSSEDSDDGGSNPGGTSPTSGGGAGGGAGGQGGTSGQGGTGGQASVDCAALCNRVRTLCEGQSTITDTWVDVCTSACGARLQLTPDVALLEKQCVEASTTCTAGVLCVASPTGSGGSGGTAG